ncbi:hypothetical protein DFH08DRAFT_826153 [Mycena albidolilacea]|uniref:Helicase C-terminal domain-containing protein n=1 Tax=Mycena albidolilacea TaxID=1033008 RepID=A0AAD7E9A6_9AGAR|nr:hypothetical protein DFH08DRAFT_826153 [Mycena albidolilacea]
MLLVHTPNVVDLTIDAVENLYWPLEIPTFTFTVIFKFICILIKLSNHLGLIFPSTAFGYTRHKTLIIGVVDPFCLTPVVIQVLLGLLEDWRDCTNKVLIFTKSVKLLEIMVHRLKVTIFLISTMAGGTGLKLTGANKVVIFDPAHDLQALDCAFQFGQMCDISVFRLLGAGSVEELIYACQIYKQPPIANWVYR